MTSNILLIWFQFTICAFLIVFAGAKLSLYGDVIANKTGISGNWIGLILLASVTSLPELLIGISSVTIADVPNIAVGDIFGSCVFNLAILIVLDYLLRGESIYRRASQDHILSAGFGVVLIGFAGLNVLLNDKAMVFNIGHIGAYSPVIIVLYLVAMRAVFMHERAHLPEFVEEIADRYPTITLRQAGVRYALAALLVIAAGTYLPFLSAELAEAMGWHTTFVGTLFVAAITSLPELTVTIAALRIGAIDMAFANLMGSNLFNIAILAFDDIIFIKGPLLSHISPMHAVSALSAVIMSGIVIIGLLYRSNNRLFMNLGWISLSLFTLYLLNTYVLYLYSE